MPINPVIAEGQSLNPDALVELYELDTAPLFTVNNVLTAGSSVYRWTAGMLDISAQGVLLGVGTASVVRLDRKLPLIAGRNYTFGCELPDKTKSPPDQVVGWQDVDNAGVIVTQIALALPLPQLPAVGAAWMISGANLLRFRGNDYAPLPIEATGFEQGGQGKLPRPKLRVSNIGGLAAALVIAYGDMLGARLTRLRTYAKFLDNGPNADFSAFQEPDIFLVDRKAAMNRDFVEWDLAAALDQQGKRIPGHIMLRDVCQHRYRQYITDSHGTAQFVYGTCPYTGGNFFDAAGTAQSDPAKDVCGLTQTDCVLRFGGAALPRDAFPGLAIMR